MKRSPGKILAFLLAFVLMVPALGNQNATVASGAASPAFSKSKVTITGAGKTYQSVIKNKVAKSTYKWSTSNKKIAKVSSKGVVTSVDKGTATIKCKITYPTKKTKTISYKVTVKVPATAITINNANDAATGAHLLTIGTSYDFNVDTVPANTSDTVYWTVEDGDASCIRLDDPLAGKVTGLKAGYVTLRATAAKSTKVEDLESSIIKDAVILQVAAPSVGITSADFVSSTEIKVVFDSAMDKSTLVDSAGKLSSNIDITAKKNVKGESAQDPGNFTAALSSDNKTLTITASKYFSGYYLISFSSNIKTTGGLAIDSYYKTINYIDTTPPAISTVTMDDTGMFMTMTFTEPINFAGLKVSNAQPVPSTVAYDASTIVYLNNRLNYVISEDQKSLTVNMSKLVLSDQNKTFEVTLSGIKDMAGNSPANYTIKADLRSDNTPKPQARFISARRSSYYTISAIFDRSILSGGWLTIDGVTLTGTVDENNKKQVNYTLSETQAMLTGTRTVSIGFWSGYNVKPGDTSADTMRNISINFSVDSSKPVMYNYEFDPETNILTLLFNEEVTLASNTGALSYKLISSNDDIQVGSNITYTKLTSTDNKTIQLKLGGITLTGNYTITIDAGFVLDNFKNASIERTIVISNSNGNSNVLPDPISITQSTVDPSEIYVQFLNKLDVTSALAVSNYTIPGVTISSARLDLNNTNGATVVLTVADGSIKESLGRPIGIAGVRGYNGSYNPIDYTGYVELRENVKPKVVGTLAFDKKTMDSIKLTFDEAVQGSMTVNISQLSNPSITYSGTVTVSDKIVTITLSSVPTNNNPLRVDILANTITDISGNQSLLSSTYIVPVAY